MSQSMRTEIRGDQDPGEFLAKGLARKESAQCGDFKQTW